MAAYPSALFVIATVPVVAVFTYRLLGFRVAVVSGFLFASNPFVMYYATNARTFGLALLLVTLSMLSFVTVIRKAGRVPLVGYIAATVLALVSNPFSCFVVLAQLIALVGTSVEPAARRRVLSGLVVSGAIVLPLFLLLLLGSRDQVDWIAPVGLDTFVEFVSDVAGRHHMVPAMAIAVVAGVACVGGVAARAITRRLTNWERALLIVWLLAPPLILGLVSLGWPLFRPRYLIGCVPAYAIVASVGVVALTRRWTILVPVIVALVAVSAATTTSITRDPGNEDYRAAARFIDEASLTAMRLASHPPGLEPVSSSTCANSAAMLPSACPSTSRWRRTAAPIRSATSSLAKWSPRSLFAASTLIPGFGSSVIEPRGGTRHPNR